MSKKKKKGCFILIIFIFILFSLSAWTIFKFYKKFFENKIHIKNQEEYLLIPTGSNFENVIFLLEEKNYITDKKKFTWLAETKNYKKKIHPGRYKIEDGMSTNELINLLRSGSQTPLNITFNSIRTKKQFAKIISKFIEASYEDIFNLINDEHFLSSYNLNSENVVMIFIPNTYEFYWNTSAKEFFKRMYKEYEKFWTKERRKKAKKINLNLREVSTLASIVEEETKKNKEKKTVAGVYMNRLKRGMLLQADPTVIFAIGDYKIKRVLHKHLEYKSPYNTYLNKGLPPAPICFPSISSINSVLNYEKHKYLFFCAKEDFSGYHNFARTLKQHNVNANKYRRALRRK